MTKTFPAGDKNIDRSGEEAKPKLFRPCVVLVFWDGQKVLVGERSDVKNSWQFPQGGIDHGETEDQAVFREGYEEIGCRDFEVLRKSQNTYRYEFPQNSIVERKLYHKYRGQEQRWFLLQFHQGFGPDLGKAPDKEFVNLNWQSPKWILDHIIAFKREVYANALKDLQLL